MTNLRIEWEWEAAPAIKSPELRATFARLRIYIGDDCITLVEDQESGSSRRAIAVSLYPLAEWLAYNWWFLCADSRHATRPNFASITYHDSSPSPGRSYERHNIRNAGDGFLWPDLGIFPEGRVTNLIWRPDRAVPAAWPIRFLKYGQAFVDSGELQQVLGSFVQSVLDRLTDCEVSQTQLAAEWAAVQSADSEEVQYCLAAARLGLDPYSEASKYEEQILEAGAILDKDLLGEFFDVVNPAHISDDLHWITSAKSEIEKMAGPENLIDPAILEKFSKNQSPVTTESPWRAGYSAARSLREAVNLGIDEAFQVETYVADSTLNAPDPAMQAFGTGTTSGPSLVLGRPQGVQSRRFTMARALWHTLRHPGQQFLIAPGHTIRQKVERAFAAELLVPADGVIALITTDIDSITDDDIEQIGQHFNVSPFVVKHQIDNQLAIRY